jgi:CheY-like chemotaxis protein
MNDRTRILVVDDSTSKRYVITSWLRRDGYDVVEAETGTEALTRMAGGDIDLAVVDVKLPDMSGFAVCEQIKRSPAHGSTPVIHVSAAAVDPVARSEGLARGADAYLTEPIDPDELLATVTAILRYYRGRRDAERLAARLSTLTRLTLRLSRARTLSWLLSEAASGATRIYGTPAMVSAVEPDGSWLVATTAGPGHPVSVRHWAPPDALPATGSYADLAADLVGVVPWMAPDTVRVVAVSARADRSPTYLAVPTGVSDPGSPVLTLLGQAVAAATDALRAYSVEHQLALTLQRSLLPRRLPHIDRVELAVRYIPASETAEIGGDFYELSHLDGHLLVAVGDVGGHSLHAATVMAELRHATRAYAAEGHSPAAVIDRLDRLMRGLMPEEIATICLLTLDPATGEVLLANAGHPAPLIIDNGEVRQLTDHGPLLGLRSPPATDHRFILVEGATMVLYTDGLVERRGEVIDQGIARLTSVARESMEDLEALCDRIVEVAAPREPTDDIAVVALRRRKRS